MRDIRYVKLACQTAAFRLSSIQIPDMLPTRKTLFHENIYDIMFYIY